MQCDVGAAVFPFIVALAAAVRYAVGRSTGWVEWRGPRNSEAYEEDGWRATHVLDRDEDPDRFALWQGAWLAIAIPFVLIGLDSLGCVF